MSLRIDTTEWIAGALVIGETGLGVLAQNIPATGDYGAGFAFGDLVFPADTGKEVCGRVTSFPAAGKLFAYEDTSFYFIDAPDGAYSFAYTLYEDGVSQGSATVSLIVGGAVAGMALTLAPAVFAGSATGSPMGTFALTLDESTFAGSVISNPTSPTAAMDLALEDALFAGESVSNPTVTQTTTTVVLGADTMTAQPDAGAMTRLTDSTGSTP